MSYPSRALLAVGLAALALLAWQLRHVALLVFGGFVFATLIGAVAGWFMRHAALPRRWAVLLAVLLFATTLTLAGWWAGGALAEQFAELQARVPRALAAIRAWLEARPLGPRLLEVWDDAVDGSIPWRRLVGLATMTLHAAATLALMVLLGIFLAAEPDLYRRGFVRLLPLPRRALAHDTLCACADALGRWLKGQGLSMLFVGTATGVGLALLGVPLALILGLIAALLGFIPYFGPFLSGALAVLLGFVEGPQVALHVFFLVLAIEQLEGNLLMPLVQRWAVRLPPVLGLVSVVVFASVFGIAGALFATPMMVVLMVLVRKAYVEGVLEREPVAQAQT